MRGLFLFCCMLLSPAVTQAEEVEKQPAFPGAEGFGRYVTGGRGGAVYHVTTLEDGTSEGTLRYAVEQSGTRTIVFDVSGTIHLTSTLNLSNPNVTIAGQTAPGDGICIADYPFVIKANNVIIRYMRFRLGNNNVTLDGADGWDGLGALDRENIIVDHCSVSWSIDECLSFCGNKNTTVQWCIVSQSLVNAGHSKGSHGYGGNWGGSGASYHHNLVAHHGSRTPRLGPRYTTQLDERMDMRNNVIYNYGGNGCYGGEAMKVNIVNNYYKPGGATKSGIYQYRIAGLGIRTESYIANYSAYEPTLHVWGKYYVDGNVNPKSSAMTSDNWTYGIYAQISAASNDSLYNDDVKDSIRLDSPLDFVYTTTHSAGDAYEKVLAYAGASLSRDALDDVMVSDTRNGASTYTGSGLSSGLINSPYEISDSPWPTLNDTGALTDTDGDGMPDTWEDANGLDKNDASDGPVVTDDGYTNLEHYLNGIVSEITEAQNDGGTAVGYIETVNTEDPVDYDLAISTYESSENTTTWNFNNGFSITNGKSKAYANAKNDCIKYSKNVQFTIVIPDGMAVQSITFTGYGNDDNNDCYLSELNGTTYDATTYVFPSRASDTGTTGSTYTITFDEAVSGTLTFTAGGAQAAWKMTLATVEASSIREVTAQTATTNGAVYSINGTLVSDKAGLKQLPKGVYIINNRKVVVK